jgi:DNA-directed RNA polymerase subunit beta'
MPYVAIPSQLKNVNSVSLELMSPEEMLNMSYGEVLTSETINYRTGTPQMNGLFCQAIFGPSKDWECGCGKYKRYRYAGVICDKCGVMVTHSSVRRERMGHISLAAPCVHPWFIRIIPSRVSLILDMKSTDVSKVTYFSAYIITEINEEIRQEYISKIDKESKNRLKLTKSEFDKKIDELSRQFQKDKAANPENGEKLKIIFEAEKEKIKASETDLLSRIEVISEVAKKELTSLNYKDVITEVVYQDLAQKFGPVFKAGIGAEAIENLLKNIDMEAEAEQLALKISKSKGQQKKKLIKRLKLIKNFMLNNTKPEWMILRRVMVLPPELRPMLQLDGGRFAASDVNELYRRLINRNNRLRKLIQIGAPEVILRNEKRMLQEAVEALIDNSAKSGRQVMASTGIKRPLKSLTDILKGKQGRFRQNLLGKRVDYSGRSVIIIGPSLKLDQCGIPKRMALELFKPFLIGRIIAKSEAGLLTEDGSAFNVHSARRLIESGKAVVYDILDEVIKDKYVLLNRAPTLHRLSFLAFKPVLIEGKAIQIHPLVCRAFNADFDGDQMAVHLPITIRGQEEAKNLMVASKNLIKPASGEVIMGAHQDMILGGYYLTAISKTPKAEEVKSFASKNLAILALDKKIIETGEIIKVKFGNGQDCKIIETTAGRIIFNECFPEGNDFINETFDKKVFEKVLNESYHKYSDKQMPEILDKIKNLTFKYSTQSGITMSFSDLQSPKGKPELLEETKDKVSKIQDLYNIGMMTSNERYKQIVNSWRHTSDSISQMTQDQLNPLNNVGIMIKSGARGNNSQLNQMVGIRGLSVTASGEIIELPTTHGYQDGLTGLEYFIGMKGQRKAQADLSLKTADAGYLTRRLVDVAQNLIITTEDCQTKNYIVLSKENSLKMNKDILERAYGRYLAKDLVVKGEVILKKNDFIDIYAMKKLEEIKEDINEIAVRSSMKCKLARGVCQRCYGMDFSNHQLIKMGMPVGIIGAQSLGENCTQLTMNSKSSGGVLTKSDITAGLPRVEELFEARIPKINAPMVSFDGKVAKIEGSVDTGYQVTITSQSNTMKLEFNPDSDKLLVSEGSNIKNEEILVQSTGELVKSGLTGVITVSGNNIIITQNSPLVEEYETPPGMSVKLKVGDLVKKGEPICEGPLNLQELLEITDIDIVQEYIINEVNGVYSANGISVNEKHIEVIIKQMCGRVIISDAGDSEYTTGDMIRYSVVTNLNEKLKESGQEPIQFSRNITGISRSSLSTDSFLSAASFQETSRVLVEAVISGRKDNLLGLKENVILGQLIPAGTGFDQSKIDINSNEIIGEDFDEEEVVTT